MTAAKCRCSHPYRDHGTARNGKPTCFGSSMCGCTAYREPTPPRPPEHLRVDDWHDYMQQKGELR